MGFLSKLFGGKPAPEPRRAADPSIYPHLRDQALNAKASDLMLDLPTNQVAAYGVVMDIRYEESSVTFAVFLTGDASMYTSSGGGMIGGIGYENVRNAGMAFIKACEKHISEMAPTTENSLPTDGNMCLYVLTNEGTFHMERSRDGFFDFDKRPSEMALAANNLMTEMRLVDESLNQAQ